MPFWDLRSKSSLSMFSRSVPSSCSIRKKTKLEALHAKLRLKATYSHLRPLNDSELLAAKPVAEVHSLKRGKPPNPRKTPCQARRRPAQVSFLIWWLLRTESSYSWILRIYALAMVTFWCFFLEEYLGMNLRGFRKGAPLSNASCMK